MTAIIFGRHPLTLSFRLVIFSWRPSTVRHLWNKLEAKTEWAVHITQQNYFKNQEDSHNCPVCSTSVSALSFAKIDQTGRSRPAIRILNIPLVLRQDTNEATNNRRGMKLFGYPHLVRLPSRVNAVDLYEVVKRVVPQEGEYTVHFVDGQVKFSFPLDYSKTQKSGLGNALNSQLA